MANFLMIPNTVLEFSGVADCCFISCCNAPVFPWVSGHTLHLSLIRPSGETIVSDGKIFKGGKGIKSS